MNGTQYAITVLWNVYGQRYYVQVADLSGNVLLYQPLISSGPQLSSTFEWCSPGTAMITTSSAHNVPIGSVANVYVSHTDSDFDGEYAALSTGPTTMSYPLQANPLSTTGQPVNGTLSFNNNLVEQVIGGAYLLFRGATQTFEYGP